MDSFRESGIARPILKDSNRGFNSWPELPKIRPVLTNPTNPDKSLVHRRTMNRTNLYQSLGFGFANLYGVQKIHFVDSFCLWCSKIRFLDLFCLWCSKDSFRGFVSSIVFKRFISWIHFARKKVKNVCFVSIRKDSCTNPTSLLLGYVPEGAPRSVMGWKKGPRGG